jgi:hypothetical protein
MKYTVPEDVKKNRLGFFRDENGSLIVRQYYNQECIKLDGSLEHIEYAIVHFIVHTTPTYEFNLTSLMAEIGLEKVIGICKNCNHDVSIDENGIYHTGNPYSSDGVCNGTREKGSAYSDCYCEKPEVLEMKDMEKKSEPKTDKDKDKAIRYFGIVGITYTETDVRVLSKLLKDIQEEAFTKGYERGLVAEREIIKKVGYWSEGEGVNQVDYVIDKHEFPHLRDCEGSMCYCSSRAKKNGYVYENGKWKVK